MNRVSLLIGVAFGFLIAGARLSDYNVIHRMLLLQEFDVFFLMGSAVATAAPLLWLLQRRSWRTPFGGPLQVQRDPVERRSLLGAVMFGAGWAVAGTCPGPAVVMTVGGTLMGIPVMAGLMTGAILRDKLAVPRAEEGPVPGGRVGTAPAWP